MCSPTSSVQDSPVVPTATMALVPSCRWKSTSLLRLSQSRPPCASMGVTSATILPAIMQPLLPENESRNGTGATSLAQATDMAAWQENFLPECSNIRHIHGRPAFPCALLFATLPALIGSVDSRPTVHRFRKAACP